jgi:uncharacterized protein YozE (UPF0346 family)
MLIVALNSTLSRDSIDNSVSLTAEKSSKVKSLPAYKLLLTTETLQRLSKLRDESNEHQGLLREALHGIASGDWERWGNSKPSFVSWREEGNHLALFSLTVPKIGALLWQRAQSVDLLGRIAYPSGAYYDQPPPKQLYSPHIVIRSILEPGVLTQFRLQFNGRLYKEEPGLEREDESWKAIESNDSVVNDEELYLLSPNMIDDFLSGEQVGLPLHLSEEQIEILGSLGAVLLSGEAGSGKTSVMTQWLVINHLRHQELRTSEPIRQLFVTFSGRLRDRTASEFKTMLPKSARNHRTDFNTYRDLLWSILDFAGERRGFPKDSEMTFERFLREYSPKVKGIDAMLLWDEIRSVIKGGATGKSDVLLDFGKYQKLSEERGQCKTPPALSEGYYDAAQTYQNYLFRNALWDGIDLARACLRHSELAPTYDKIACDEVQDLAPVEIVLLFGLLQRQDLSNLFFTGDTAQVINPSGFLWARLKQELYENFQGQKSPDVQYLRRNYRSCYEIVDLVNKVLAVRRELLDDEVSHIEQTPLLRENVRPMVLRESPIEDLKSLVSNPNLRLILTKTPKEKEKLSKELGQASDNVTILTIEEAKGLEYEGVLLWNFFLPRHEIITKNDWERIFTPERRERLRDGISNGQVNPYGLTYEFNLLHVGLTRCRKLLFVYDQDPEMRIANLGAQVATELTDAYRPDFATHWKTERPTPQDLQELGQRLLDRDRVQARRMFMLAAEAAEKIGQLRQAAESYEHGHAYDLSAKCYRAISDESNELRVQSLHYQSRPDWAKAGKCLEDRGALLLRRGDRTEASESFEDARPLYEQAADMTAAARCVYQSAESLPEDKNRDRAYKFADSAECFGSISDHTKAVQAREKAIQEAQKAKDAGKHLQSGEPDDHWIARQYRSIGTLEEARHNDSESARASRQAAGLWMNLIDDPQFAKTRSQYEALCWEALASSVESFIRGKEIVQASSVQAELYKKFRGGVEESKERWTRFASLYFEKSEFDQYGETLLQLSTYLSDRKEYRGAMDQLDSALEKISSRGAARLVLKLVEKRVEVARMTKDSRGLGESLEKLASAYVAVGELLRAFENLRNAALEYARVYDNEKADKLFDQGYELAKSIMAPTEMGWYCYRYAAVEAFGVRGIYNKSFFWLKRATVHFSQDSEGSLKRLESQWEEQEREVNRLQGSMEQVRTKDSEENLQAELRSRALTEVALAKVNESTYTNLRAESILKASQDWRKRANESFETVEDPQTAKEIEQLLQRLLFPSR